MTTVTDERIFRWLLPKLARVFFHFRRWINDSSFRWVWVKLLKQQRKWLGLSSVQLDGSQTICKNSGDCISYQVIIAANS
jgi:hypothetical protein